MTTQYAINLDATNMDATNVNATNEGLKNIDATNIDRIHTLLYQSANRYAYINDVTL